MFFLFLISATSAENYEELLNSLRSEVHSIKSVIFAIPQIAKFFPSFDNAAISRVKRREGEYEPFIPPYWQNGCIPSGGRHDEDMIDPKGGHRFRNPENFVSFTPPFYDEDWYDEYYKHYHEHGKDRSDYEEDWSDHDEDWSDDSHQWQENLAIPPGEGFDDDYTYQPIRPIPFPLPHIIQKPIKPRPEFQNIALPPEEIFDDEEPIDGYHPIMPRPMPLPFQRIYEMNDEDDDEFDTQIQTLPTRPIITPPIVDPYFFVSPFRPTLYDEVYEDDDIDPEFSVQPLIK